MLKKLLFGGLLKLGLELGLKSKTPKYIALNLIGTLFLGLALLFSLIALHDYLSFLFNPMIANAFFAAGFAMIGTIVLLVRAGLQAKAQQQSNAQRLAQGFEKLSENAKDYLNPALNQAKQASENLQHSLNRNTLTYLLGAAVLGLLLGNRSRNKKTDA